MEFQEILYEVGDRVATITLNRPERMNAFTVRMCHELIAALDRADEDDEVRSVIVTGAGKAFCAGADLGSGGGTFDGTQEGSTRTVDTHRDEGGLVALRIYEMKKPVIGAINGAAVGVGITMTLPMDLRIAAAGAKIGFVFARRGIVPEAASSWFLPRLSDRASGGGAYTGRIFQAEEAHAAGLVSRVVELIEVVATAREIAREIAENTSAVSIALTRKLLWTMLGASSPMEAHRVDSKCIFWMGKSPDAYEGVRRSSRKRPPGFTMKPSSDMPPFYLAERRVLSLRRPARRRSAASRPPSSRARRSGRSPRSRCSARPPRPPRPPSRPRSIPERSSTSPTPSTPRRSTGPRRRASSSSRRSTGGPTAATSTPRTAFVGPSTVARTWMHPSISTSTARPQIRYRSLP